MAKKTNTKSNGANGAKLSPPEIEARTGDLVAALRELEGAKQAKKDAAKAHGAKVKGLEERVAELREEVATGMLAPSKRQASLALDDPAPATKPKRKRAARKAEARA